jgi:two-component system cell cycle response regulator
MRSVRSRLALVLGFVLLVPAFVAVVAIAVLAPLQQRNAAGEAMQQAAGSVASALQQQCLSLGESARVLGLESTVRPASATDTSIERQARSFAVIVRAGKIVASSGAVPALDLSTSGLARLSCSGRTGAARGSAGPGTPVVAEVVPITSASGAVTGRAVVGQVLDSQRLGLLADSLSLPHSARVTLACPDGTGASTDPSSSTSDWALATGSLNHGESGGAEFAQVNAAQGLACAVVTSVDAPGLGANAGWLAVALAVVAVVAGFLVLRLASSLTRPVLALTEAAERVSRGDLSTRLPDDSPDELGRLSGAFNRMTDDLDQKITELQRSRDLLRENVSRLGDTLERTHDLEGLLGTVLAAAVSATEANRATAWLVEGGSVVARAAVPVGAPRAAVRRLPLGTDIAGEVASDGLPRRLGHGHEDSTTVLGGPALAAPLRRGHNTLGVIVVEREAAGPAFDTDDEAMLVSLAGPAGIAVDNVMLHREAQRLSVTDPLTGAGNLRHMTTTLAREVERSSRFDRPLSVLLLDLDHFKNVNDTYGHSVGDAVLRELARRLASCVREVDTVARYGGEEFVVVTPETDTDGARRLANRICEVVREEPFVVGDDNVIVTVSVGIASLPIHGTASGDLVRAADDGLYAAKRAGRDQWKVAPITTRGAAHEGFEPDDVALDR